MKNDLKHIRIALARALAERTVSDEAVDAAAAQLAAIQHPIRGLDVCAYGICIDFFLEGHDWWRLLPELVKIEGGRLRGIEIFPWGIIDPDIIHVRVMQSLDAMPEVRG